MPFDQFVPRPFTAGAIETFAPVESGIYGISNARSWIYIGAAEDIRGALLAHLQGFDPLLANQQPTGFVFEICNAAHRSTRQDRLVVKYAPTCNRHSTRSL